MSDTTASRRPVMYTYRMPSGRHAELVGITRDPRGDETFLVLREEGAGVNLTLSHRTNVEQIPPTTKPGRPEQMDTTGGMRRLFTDPSLRRR